MRRKPENLPQAGDGLLDQLVFVTVNGIHADTIEIVDRRAETHRVGDVSGSRLEPRRSALVGNRRRNAVCRDLGLDEQGLRRDDARWRGRRPGRGC